MISRKCIKKLFGSIESQFLKIYEDVLININFNFFCNNSLNYISNKFDLFV